MARNNQNKTISCNSNGIVISYGDANKHQFMKYETPAHVKKIQLEGTVKYQKIEVKFSSKQKDLLNKTLYGFNAYSRDEVRQMSEATRMDISKRYSIVQRVLNNWKQDLTFSFIDKLLLSLFPKSPVVKAMCETKGHISDVPKEDEISFEDLGITKQAIADKLMEYGLLPQNFYQLV